MKFMKKIKDILFDEEEVEIPVIEEKTKSVKKTIIDDEDNNHDSITEIKMPDDFSDKDNLKSELTFPFPIDFDDEELEKTKPIETFRNNELPKRENIQSREREYYNSYNKYDIKKDVPVRKEREIKDYSSYLRNKEEKKQFKPTPIISPVYGVLDQNYKKDDVVVKNVIKRDEEVNSKPSLDEVRNKVYSLNPLEDSKEVEIVDVDDVNIDTTKTIGELFDEVSIKSESLENNNNRDENIIDISEEPSVELNDLINEKDNIEKKLDTKFDDDIEEETDLFSLIDSMYEENNE